MRQRVGVIENAVMVANYHADYNHAELQTRRVPVFIANRAVTV
jgi:hypothetical protein